MVLAIEGAMAFGEFPSIQPSHGRPYFMSERKRDEIREMVRTQVWAKDLYEALKAAARGKKPGSGGMGRRGSLVRTCATPAM